jgi:ribulose-5-phosphate 4-epimerase/fuculose-1-phosphate aldolase
MSEKSNTPGSTGNDVGIEELKRKLILANKILDLENLAKPLGHVSIRILGTETFLITRSVAPGMAVMEDIVICDLQGEIIQGKHPRTYSEVVIHAGVYKKRKEINSVIHVHPPYVMALSMVEAPIVPASFDAVELGPQPIAIFKKVAFIETMQDGEDIADLLRTNKAVMLKGHGSVTVGKSVEEAVYITLKMEFAARLQWMAASVGKLVPFTEQEKEPLLAFLQKMEVWGETGNFLNSYRRGWEYYESILKMIYNEQN